MPKTPRRPRTTSSSRPGTRSCSTSSCASGTCSSPGSAVHSDELLSRGLFRAGRARARHRLRFRRHARSRSRAWSARTGEAVGVDCAQNFIETGEQDAAAAGVPQRPLLRRRRAGRRPARPVRPRVLALRHDVLHVARCRRCGTSGKALKPGGEFAHDRLAQARGQPVAARRRAARARDRARRVARGDATRCTAARARSRCPAPTWSATMLKAAGFDRHRLRALSTPTSASAATSTRRSSSRWRSAPRARSSASPAPKAKRLKPKVVAALRETLARYARKDGVWAPSSTWFITARNPGLIGRSGEI